MPTENKYYLCDYCGKNFGNDYEGCRKHEKEHQDNKVFKIVMAKNATNVTVEKVDVNGKLCNFVYQTSCFFFILVKNKSEIKAAFETLKNEAIKYYNILLERDKKILNIVSENLKKLEVNDDETTMKNGYFA